jgi:hypothetical protein
VALGPLGDRCKTCLCARAEASRLAVHDAFQAFHSFIAPFDVITGPTLHLDRILAGFIDLLLAEWTDHRGGLLAGGMCQANKDAGSGFQRDSFPFGHRPIIGERMVDATLRLRL